MISRIEPGTLLLLSLSGLALSAYSQQPVQWSYTATKIDTSTYEVHVTAVLADGWHIYALDQPKEAIAVPTKIAFKANPMLTTVGKTKEAGKKEIQKIDALDIQQFEYTNTVDFVQTITLKAAVKTTLSGTVTFQACTDKQCLPPKEETFNLLL